MHRHVGLARPPIVLVDQIVKVVALAVTLVVMNHLDINAELLQNFGGAIDNPTRLIHLDENARRAGNIFPVTARDNNIAHGRYLRPLFALSASPLYLLRRLANRLPLALYDDDRTRLGGDVIVVIMRRPDRRYVVFVHKELVP